MKKLTKMYWRRVSMVAHPAIRTSFFVKKEETPMQVEEMEKEFPLDAELVEAFKGKTLSDDAKAAIEKAVKALAKWKEDMPADCVKALGVLTKAAGMAYGSYPEKSKKEEALEKECAELRVLHSPEARKKEIDSAIATVEQSVAVRVKEAVEKAVAETEDKLLKESVEAFDAVMNEKVG